jgi:LCP family protein required for cell wall assembly
MSGRKRNLVLAGVGLTAILLLVGIFAYPRLQELWTQPLGASLDLPTLTPTETPIDNTATPASVAQADTESTPEVADTAIPPSVTPAPTPTTAPLCGGPPTMTILGVGADSRGDTYLYGLADVIRVARVDFVTPKITVLSIPRDIWVEIPGIADHYDITHGKLNQSYLYGGVGLGYYDGPGFGPGLLARTLDQNFGLRVDHYGAVNMTTFERIVDAVGGIDIFLPEPVDGRPIDDQTEDMGFFRSGEHHFNGNQALRFSRIRKKYNDFTRMSNQNMVLCALREKILSPAVLPDVPEIILAFQDSVQTDLSLEQLSQLACVAPQVKSENLIFTGVPEELLEATREYSPQLKDTTFAYSIDPDEFRQFMADFQSGAWPTQPDEPSCQ